jgi:L-2,4-diaminobutyrate decarboxylase
MNINALFSPDLFRKNVSLVLDELETYLSDSSIRGLSFSSPADLLKSAASLMETKETEDSCAREEKIKKIIQLYIKTGIQVYSPGYMARQFSGVVPLAGAIDFVSSMVSQPSSFYEAAPLPNMVEHLMAEELNQFIGWPSDSYAMITTSGGSLATMTAMLAARNDKYPQFWSQGAAGLHGLRPAVAVGEDVHYSVQRAVGILGIGEDQIVRLPLNKKKQIDVNKVPSVLDAAAQDGLDMFCMVVSAGTTATGAFDPLDALADITASRKIWLHVDGAHGASLLVSDKLRHKLNGIDKADSFAWDAHKTMFVPAVCTLLFYKNKAKSYRAFQQEASYVFEKKEEDYAVYESAKQNFECTKRPLIMSLWVLWAVYGRQLFAEKIEYLCKLTHNVWCLLQEQPDMEVLHEPECNILCFRYIPKGLPCSGTILADVQLAIRNQLTKEGKFFISKVDIDGITALRVVFMNHTIDLSHVKMLLAEIRRIGQSLLAAKATIV